MNDDEDFFVRSAFVGVLILASYMFYIIFKTIIQLNTTYNRNKSRIINGYSTYDFYRGDPTEDNYEFNNPREGNITRDTMLAHKQRWLSSVRNNLEDVTNFKSKHNLDTTIKAVHDNMEKLYSLPKNATVLEKDLAADRIYTTDAAVLDQKYDDYDYSTEKSDESYWSYLFENSKMRLRPSEQAIYIKSLEDRIASLETR